MLDRDQLKADGIRFALALQVVFKTVSLFSADHVSAKAPFQQSFDLLNALLKETGQFTVGFVEQQVLISNILTTEKALNHLGSEFQKRGIAAVTFYVGIALASYKRGLSILSKSAKVIEKEGGLRRYLDQNPMEFMRVYPASKPKTGDTVLEMGSESFLMTKAPLRGAAPQRRF